MPGPLRRPCLHPGCPALTDRGRCPAHERAPQQRHDRDRGSSAQRGYGGRWRRLRRMILARDPVCVCRGLEGCLHVAGGCVQLATDVDHVLPRLRGGTDAEDNLQGLCKACHSRKTVAEDGGWGRRPRDRQGDA